MDAYMLTKHAIRARRASCAQEYSTGYAQDLDEIRALWMAMAQRREALMVRDAHADLSHLWFGSHQHRSRGLLSKCLLVRQQSPSYAHPFAAGASLK